jgi:hypothetical protein
MNRTIFSSIVRYIWLALAFAYFMELPSDLEIQEA